MLGGVTMSAKTIHIRVDSEVKDNAEEILNSLGLTLSGAVNVFLRKIIQEKGIPFSLKSDSKDLN